MPLFSTARHSSEMQQQQQQQQQQQHKSTSSDSSYECYICFDIAKEAVVTLCGHLFCWTCLYKWLDEIDSDTLAPKGCPVCRSVLTLDRIIPVFGRGDGTNNQNDPRSRLHPRPPGLRTELPSRPQEQIYQINILPIVHTHPEILGWNFHFTLGIGSLIGYMLLLFCLKKRIEKI